jgi:O-antigen/teichoic acid export membrane protein
VSRQLRLVGQLLGSTVLAQVAVLGAIAAAARATTARDFADYGVVTSVTAVVATFNTWAAESRTTVVEEDRAHEISRAGLAVLWMVLALITLAAALAAVMGQHRLGLLLGLGGIGAAVTGGLQLVQGVVLRRQQQHLLAHSRATQGLSNAALILLFLAIGLPGFVIITIPWLISLVLGLAVLLRATGDRPLWWGRSSWAEWRVLRSETRWQPGSNVLVSLAGALPMLVLPAVGAVEVAGAWALVARFLMPVVSTLNSTFGPIYLGHAAGMIRRRELPQLRRYHARWTLLLAAGMVLLLGGATYAVLVLVPLLGPQWSAAGSVLVAALLYFGSMFWCVPVSQTLVLLGRVDTQAWWSVARAVLCAIPMLWAASEPRGALTGWAAMAALTFVAQLGLHRIALKSSIMGHKG